MEARNILFRADSSSTIGTGHIMRDLVLAEQFEEDNVIFATQNLSGNINQKIKEKNYKIEILKSNNIEEVNKLIKKHNIDMIVIDHYHIDEKYEKQLKLEYSTLKVMVLDDTYEKHYCDILLNHNINATVDQYKQLVPTHCEIRCGARYTLLRDEFTVIEKKERDISNKKILNVLIMMGGTDPQNFNIKILELISYMENITFEIVTTSANVNLRQLKDLVSTCNNTILHIDSTHIAHLMNVADFAIVTPSVAVNEIIFMNLPFIAIKIINNQQGMYDFLEDHGLPVLEKNNFYELEKYVLLMCQYDFYNTVKDVLMKLSKGNKC